MAEFLFHIQYGWVLKLHKSFKYVYEAIISADTHNRAWMLYGSLFLEGKDVTNDKSKTEIKRNKAAALSEVEYIFCP